MQGIVMREVRDALVNAFDQNALTEMLKFRMNIDLFTEVAPGALNSVVFNLLLAAEMKGFEAELIEAAYQERPRNSRVRSVYEKYRLAPAVKLADPDTVPVRRSRNAHEEYVAPGAFRSAAFAGTTILCGGGGGGGGGVGVGEAVTTGVVV